MKPDGKRVECRKGIQAGKNWVQFLALPVLRHIYTYLSTLRFIFIRSRDPWASDLWLAWPWLQTFLSLFNSSFLYHVRLIPSLYLQLLFSWNFNPVSFTFSLHIFLIKLWRYWSGPSSPTVGIVFRGVRSKVPNRGWLLQGKTFKVSPHILKNIWFRGLGERNNLSIKPLLALWRVFQISLGRPPFCGQQ